MPAPVAAVLFRPDGSYLALDGARRPVLHASGLWWADVVRDQIARGVSGPDTVVNVPGVVSGKLTAAHVATHVGPCFSERAAIAASVFFYAQGFYYTIDAKKNNVPSECSDWWLVVLKKLLAAGLVDDHCVVGVPTVYDGPLFVLRSSRNF